VLADPPLTVQYDGEVTPAATPMTARVLPRAATFIVADDDVLPSDDFGSARPAR
jgi:diacylglycerol kinase family enzyme